MSQHANSPEPTGQSEQSGLGGNTASSTNSPEQTGASGQGHTFGSKPRYNFPSETVSEAQQYVERFRAGSSSRRGTESAIRVVLQRGAAEIGAAYTDLFLQPYLHQLDAHEQTIREAETSGQDHGLADDTRAKRKRLNTPPVESDNSDDEETVRLPRRKKIDKSKLAWETDLEATELREPVKQVVTQLENFSRDPKDALRLLKASGGAPVFPDDSWKELLAGSFVNFDSVNKELFGGSSIRTEEEWNRVWRAYERAMAFAFRDRRTELDTYGTFVSDFFLQFKPELHVNVIAFDKAARTYIANSRNILFSDTSRFSHLEKSYLVPAAINPNEVKRSVGIGMPADVLRMENPALPDVNMSATVDRMRTERKIGRTAQSQRDARQWAENLISPPTEHPILRFSTGHLPFHEAVFCSSSYEFDGANYNDDNSLSDACDSFIPRYLRGYAWRNNSPCSSITAAFTEIDSPLPRPLYEEFLNKEALQTIEDNPDLFNVSTEIDVDVFEDLLTGSVPGSLPHPNQAFVSSVVQTLSEGSWPFARTQWNDGYPLTYDNSVFHPQTEEQRLFLEQYSHDEEAAGRHSRDFGPDLLPGMYSTPVLSVPKPHSSDLRMVHHMSCGECCQNSMMDRSQTKGARLDTLHNFIAALLLFRRHNPSVELVAWKSDVAGAFRLIPLHPLWQLKQIVTTNYPSKSDLEDGTDRGPLRRRVDWRCSFGSCASPRAWASVMGLVLWIAIFVFGLMDIFAYVDDNFGWEIASNFLLYEPYGVMMPAKQVHLLRIWDLLGIPHKQRKQLHGKVLEIIGFLVDVNAMTITLPDDAKANLINAVQEFIDTPGRRRKLHEWQQLAGWMCWSLNVYPRLRPGLCHVYQKMSKKANRWGYVRLNEAVKDDLRWFLHHVSSSPGVLVFQSTDWNPVTESDFEVRCDACLEGLGFWSPALRMGSYAEIQEIDTCGKIFFWEAVAVLAAIEWFIFKVLPCAAHIFPSNRPFRLTILSDNTNTVHIFDSLAAEPGYNDILKAAVDLLLQYNVDLRVVHIPGSENEVADAISRHDFARATRLVPDISITGFQPPRCTLGAAKK